MGGVEDEEPATKRMKLSSGELKALSNGASLADPLIAGSSGDHHLMARPIQQSSSSPSSSSPSSSSGDGEVVGTKGVIKRVEFVRIIAKALYSLGYNKSGARLEEESGISLHSDTLNRFTQQVLGGDWAECLTTLREISALEESTVKSASFMILERKFFELLDGDKVADALATLRAEITPLGINARRVRELSSCLVAPLLFGGPATRVETREKLLQQLQELLPPMVMVPEKRLEHLVEQALVLQRDACYFHNSLNEEMSLYTDHHCGKEQIPSKTSQVLHEHSNEVWYVQFSHDGKYLASSSNDGSAIIWEVNMNEVKLKHRLSGHQRPVSLLSWSPDDGQLLSCGVEESVRRWDVSSGQCLHVYEKPGLGLVSCGWFPDGKSIFSGVNDKSICMWELGGKEIECWKGQRTLRISDLEITRDGKHVISISRESAILLLDREAKAERLIEEDQTITSFSLSKDNDFLLVNLLNQEIHLWSISGEAKLVTKYKGHKRSRFIIRSCFGGTEQAFIASGSEDSQVYIWHRGTGELIEALPGHSGAVNCVSWNPANPHMVASASDDRTIRIWGLNGLTSKHNGAVCNGVHHCNGKT